MTTNDCNYTKNTDKANDIDNNHKTDIARSIGRNPLNGKLISEILSGDYRFIIGRFRGMLRNGHFSCIRSLSEFEIGHWEKELCHDVHMAILKKVRDPKTEPILYVPAFVETIIWYKCLDENSRRKKRGQLLSLLRREVTKTYKGIDEIAYNDRIEHRTIAKQELPERKKRLNKKHLRIIELREEEGWSYDQLANEFSSTVNSMRVTMCNIRKKLKKPLA